MNKLPTIKNLNKLSAIEQYEKAGLYALADFKRAQLILKGCKKLEITTYHETPWRIEENDGASIDAVIEPISKWIGDIPTSIVDSLSKSEIDHEKLFILDVKNVPDPVLLYKFYSGEAWYRMGHGHAPCKKYNYYYMELTRWE